MGVWLSAPPADMTDKLIEPGLPPEAKTALADHGVWTRPSLYDDGYPITAALLEEGRRWSILPGPVPVHAPLHVLQGAADPDVPWRHALALTQAWSGKDVVFTLI